MGIQTGFNWALNYRYFSISEVSISLIFAVSIFSIFDLLRFIIFLPFSNSTLLHSFVIFPMRKTIFGMRGCFPASHGQEMKDLIASRGRRPREAVNVHFQPKWGWKTASRTKNCFSHREIDKWMEYITFFDFAAHTTYMGGL